MPFSIRDYAPDDFDTLWRIDQHCFEPGIAYSRTELRFYMRRTAAFTLVAANIPDLDADTGKAKKKSGAYRQDSSSLSPHSSSSFSSSSSPPHSSSSSSDDASAEVAGFIVAEAGPRARGHVLTIDVIAAARRSGVGSLLLRAAEDRLVAASVRAVELETGVDNFSALAFYARHGYRVLGTFARYYANGTDALVLEKVLVP